MQRKEAQKRGQGFMQGNFNSSNSSMMGGYGGGGSGYSPSSESLPSMRESPSSYSRPSSNATPATSKAKGMQLGRKPKAADLFEAIKPDVEEPLMNTTSYHQKTAQSNQERFVRMMYERNLSIHDLCIVFTLILRSVYPLLPTRTVDWNKWKWEVFWHWRLLIPPAHVSVLHSKPVMMPRFSSKLILMWTRAHGKINTLSKWETYHDPSQLIKTWRLLDGSYPQETKQLFLWLVSMVRPTSHYCETNRALFQLHVGHPPLETVPVMSM